jgi:hypothetical protein
VSGFTDRQLRRRHKKVEGEKDMKRMTLKLTRVLIVTLLCATGVTTASSQESPKVDENALAARGEEIANQDPLALELRNLLSGDPMRQGFYIGMAAAEGQTVPGPGKQKIHDSLSKDKQVGFSVAVSFSLERNRNAELAAVGAKIALADPLVAEARNARPPDELLGWRSDIIFYRLGFDIATGIFGDRARGALGNTATGPGSLKIRDSLSAAGQGGFNASVKLHLGQAPPSSAPEARPRGSEEVTSIDNTYKSDKVYAGLKNAGSDPTANEIRCRGYSHRGGSEYVFFDINSRTSQTGATIVTYEMAFTTSVKAAGSNGEGLQPGECSFVDRPISTSARYRIRFETPDNAQLNQQLHGTPLDTSPTAAERFPDTQTIPAYLRDQNHYWSFFGARSDGNFFVTTGNRYWKPAPEMIRPVDSKRINRDNPYVLAPRKPE